MPQESPSAAPHYIDERTGATYDLMEPRWRSDDGNTLAVSDLPGITRADIDTGERSLWRYRASFPVDIKKPVSMGEGCTPLVPHPAGIANCYLKQEWFSPSGSFKDRGAAVMLSFLRQLGVEMVLEDSSGNGGSAIAAFGAAAGMKVKIFTPAGTQPSKIAQIRAYGAEVELVPGPREASEHAAIAEASQAFYASHNWHPFFLQGTKTLGYELWEDLGYTAPDNVIIPTGAGSNVMGCDIAFRELLASGEISRLPRLFAAQPRNCAPIDACFRAGSDEPGELDFAPTIAEGTAIKRPVRLKTVLDAIRRSGGGTVALGEDQILEALKSLAAHGVYIEPTSASAYAAYKQLIETKEISEDETTVLILTGTGLKATAFMTELYGG